MYSNPPALFDPTGPWSIVADAGPLVCLAGLRGIDPATNALVEGDLPRVRQVFANLRLAVASVGLGLGSVMRLTVFVTDMKAHRPLVNQVQQEVWGAGPYPPRTIVQVVALNQDDIVEVEATLYRRPMA
jgi:enamine deaminase RidA (YjgF/YER057c/UK114 family)